MTRPDWDTYFGAIAQAVAARADCTRRQVGAVLVGPDHSILSTGYNGAPAGEPGCASAGACPRGQSDVPTRSQYVEGAGRCIAVHAEENALLYAMRGHETRDGWVRSLPMGVTAYVTCAPCQPCAELLAAAGVERVVWPKEST